MMKKILGKPILKKKTINSGLAGDVFIAETDDNSKYVVKSYNNSTHSIENEWKYLNLLFTEGLDVPKPYEKNDNSIVMELIHGKNLGTVFFEYKNMTEELIFDFTKLLYKLHKITIEKHVIPEIDSSKSFIKNEITQIKNLATGNNTYDKYI
jgi:serine/threonine-protein kinase RIO1